MSACIAERLAIVSSRLSPLAVDEAAMSRLMTSAERRLAAISKVVRVRVEFSKKRLKTLLPRRSGTFLTSRSLTLRNVPAVSRMWLTMDAGKPSIDSRWISSSLRLSCGLRRTNMAGLGTDLEAETPGVVARQRETLRGRQLDARHRQRRLDRQLAVAAIDENGQGDAGRTAEIVELVDGGADGAAGVEHIVDQDDAAALDLERQAGVVGARGQTALRKIVAVQGARDDACLAAQRQIALQPFGDPRATRPDADQHGVRAEQGADAGEQARVERFGVEVDAAHRATFALRAAAFALAAARRLMPFLPGAVRG